AYLQMGYSSQCAELLWGYMQCIAMQYGRLLQDLVYAGIPVELKIHQCVQVMPSVLYQRYIQAVYQRVVVWYVQQTITCFSDKPSFPAGGSKLHGRLLGGGGLPYLCGMLRIKC